MVRAEDAAIILDTVASTRSKIVRPRAEKAKDEGARPEKAREVRAESKPTVFALKDAQRYLPADTTALMCLNVSQLLDSELYRKYRQELAGGFLDSAEMKALRGAGFDTREVHRLFVASVDVTEGDKLWLLIQGAFTTRSLEEVAKKYAESNAGKLRTRSEAGRTVYEIKVSDITFFAVSPSDGVLIATTSKDQLEEALKDRKSPLSEQLQSGLKQVDPKASLWLAGIVTGRLKEKLIQVGLKEKFQFVTANVDVTEEVRIAARIQTGDEEEAEQLLTKLKLLLSVAPAHFDGREVKAVRDGLSLAVDRNDRSVTTVHLKLTADQVARAFPK
jgi:hypothetical protein